MMRLIPFSMVAALVPCFACAAETPSMPGGPDTPEFKKTTDLIRQLGDARFQVRESAARQIVDLGRAAKPALQAAAATADAEVADRCRRLLVQALTADFKARAEAFVADKDGTQEHDLPGWGRFQKEVGADKDSRTLFADMLKTNQALFLTLEHEPKAFPERYAARCGEMTQQFLYNRNAPSAAQPTAGDLATIFLFGQDPETARAISGNNNVVNLLYMPAFQSTLRSGASATAFRKLFVGWMEQRTDMTSISQCLSIVQQQNIKEGLRFAASVVRNRETPVFLRAQALTVIGKMGDQDHIALLEGAFTPAYLMGGAVLAGVKSGRGALAAPLDDDTLVTNINLNGKMATVQLRDVALAMAIHLSGQKPQNFGYEFVREQPSGALSYHFYGFAADDDTKTANAKRAEARKKWEDSRTAPAKK